MINYKHLYYFLSVARSGGVGRAAERLHLSPQTLSGQISQFEERMGVAPLATQIPPPLVTSKSPTLKVA